jgi:hypothetical protein
VFDKQVSRFLRNAPTPSSGQKSILSMEAPSPSETFVPIYQTTRRHIPEDTNIVTANSSYISNYKSLHKLHWQDNDKGKNNRAGQAARVTKFCKVVPNICGS